MNILISILYSIISTVRASKGLVESQNIILCCEPHSHRKKKKNNNLFLEHLLSHCEKNGHNPLNWLSWRLRCAIKMACRATFTFSYTIGNIWKILKITFITQICTFIPQMCLTMFFHSQFLCKKSKCYRFMWKSRAIRHVVLQPCFWVF